MYIITSELFIFVISQIKKFEILEKDGQNILFKAEVQGGTYIRKLISDLGDNLGIGAHMLELRRIRAGIFKEDSSINLYDLEKAFEEYKKGNDKELRNILIPGEIVSEVYPVVEIKENNLKNILTGKLIYIDDLENAKDSGRYDKNDLVCIFYNNRLIEIARVVNENRIFSKPEFVYFEKV